MEKAVEASLPRHPAYSRSLEQQARTNAIKVPSRDERATRRHPLVGGRRGAQEYSCVRLIESYQLMLLAVSPHQVQRVYRS